MVTVRVMATMTRRLHHRTAIGFTLRMRKSIPIFGYKVPYRQKASSFCCACWSDRSPSGTPLQDTSLGDPYKRVRGFFLVPRQLLSRSVRLSSASCVPSLWVVAASTHTDKCFRQDPKIRPISIRSVAWEEVAGSAVSWDEGLWMGAWGAACGHWGR